MNSDYVSEWEHFEEFHLPKALNIVIFDMTHILMKEHEMCLKLLYSDFLEYEEF